MLDNERVERLREILCDRFTPEELIEILGVTTNEVIDQFFDEVLRTDWSEHL